MGIVKLNLEELESRCCPTYTWGGGPLLDYLQVYQIGSDSYQNAAMQNVLSNYLGPYLNGFYGLRGGEIDGYGSSQGLVGTTLTNGQIQTYLASLIDKGLVASPTISGQCYALYLKPGQVVTDFPDAAGYHSFFVHNNVPVYYMVILSYPEGYGPIDVSIIEAHEAAELATDPQIGTNGYGWWDRSTGFEIEDANSWLYEFKVGPFYAPAASGPNGEIINRPGMSGDGGSGGNSGPDTSIYDFILENLWMDYDLKVGDINQAYYELDLMQNNVYFNTPLGLAITIYIVSNLN